MDKIIATEVILMPANILIFDADYVAELTAKMNIACELMEAAVSSLKNASNHEKWECKERERILEEFGELNVKLDRLNTGVNETTKVLRGSVSRFAALETQYDSQANSLREELTGNFGFSATVHTGGNLSGIVGAGAAGAAGAGTLNVSEGQTTAPSGENTHEEGGKGKSARNSSGGAAGFHIGGGSMRNRRTDSNTNTATNSAGTGAMTGGGSMNVNLPVTRIPDNKKTAEAAENCTKSTLKTAREIANAALNSVVGTMTKVLAGGNLPDSGSDFDRTAARLAEAYNAGRSVFEAGAVIIANPSQPHTSERLAMAAGLVALAQGTEGNIGVSVSGSGNFSQNAVRISSALQGNNEASEFKSLLSAITGISSGSTSSSGSSSGESLSFFDIIIEELKKAFSGNNESVSSSQSSLASSSPVAEFLGSFVMDQAV